MTLAGDVGGTKAYLGIFRPEGPGVACEVEDRFATAEFAGIEELLVVREQAGIRGDLLAALPGFGIHFRDRTKTNTVEAY